MVEPRRPAVIARPGSTRRLAVSALLLALLVPARAIALCCLGVAGPAVEVGAHATHGPTPHHRAGGEPATVGPALGAAAESGCTGLQASAPALRERDRSGDTAPGAGDPPLALIARVRDLHPPVCLAPHSLTPVSQPHGVENLHPLRL